MGVGFNPNNFGLMILISFGVFLVPVVLLVIARILGFILGMRQSSLPGIVATLGLVGLILALPTLIDTFGMARTAQVIGKEEGVRVRLQGDWQEQVALTLRYDVTGKPLPPLRDHVTTFLELGEGSQQAVTIRPPLPDFDALQPGEPLEVRVLQLGEIFSLVHPAGWPLWAWIPPSFLIVGGGLLVVGMIAWQLRKTPLGWAIIALLALGAVANPVLSAYRTAQFYADTSAATGLAQATVRSVTRITEIDLCDGRGRESCDYQVRQPYEIVQFDFTPANYDGPIIGVDAVDVDVRQPSRFEKGGVVEIGYRPDNPRDVRVSDATRTHYWQTTVGVYTENALLLLFAAAVIAIGPIIGFVRRRTRQGLP